MLFSLTVGKVDAGVAVLLTDDNRIIEFPTILLPKHIASGSIVDIRVSHNTQAQDAMNLKFQSLQTHIHQTFGVISPSAPVLRCRNITQTSVVLEWDPIFLATAELRSLTLYRNGSKTGNIPRPMEMTTTKVSGLAVDTDYTFHLELRTTAGVYLSQKLNVRTHKMTDLSGVRITCGVIPPEVKEDIHHTAAKLGAQVIDSVRIDTTHFLCTEGKGAPWKMAQSLNIPVVHPEWLRECERQNRIVGVRNFYLESWEPSQQTQWSSQRSSQQSHQQQPYQQFQQQQQHQQGQNRRSPPTGSASTSESKSPELASQTLSPQNRDQIRNTHVSTLSNVTRMSDFVPNDDPHTTSSTKASPTVRAASPASASPPPSLRVNDSATQMPPPSIDVSQPDEEADGQTDGDTSLANLAYSPPQSPMEPSFGRRRSSDDMNAPPPEPPQIVVAEEPDATTESNASHSDRDSGPNGTTVVDKGKDRASASDSISDKFSEVSLK